MIRRSTWITLLVFVVVLAGAMVWTRRAPINDAAETSPTPASLWSYDESQVQGLRIEDLKAGKIVEVHRNPDVAWKLTQPDEEPADAGRVEQAITWLRSPNVSRVLTADQDLGPFGLADPAVRVTLLLQDGTSQSFDVGASTGIAGTAYIRVAGGDQIQVVSGYSLDDVTGLLDDIPVVPPTATPVATAQGGTPGASTPAP
jgi:hypothetical protein